MSMSSRHARDPQARPFRTEKLTIHTFSTASSTGRSPTLRATGSEQFADAAVHTDEPVLCTGVTRWAAAGEFQVSQRVSRRLVTEAHDGIGSSVARRSLLRVAASHRA